MKTFELPIGANFIAGIIGPNTLKQEEGEPPYPQYGVIVFYEDEDAARTACANACKAHWGDDP